ncbi:UDP-glucose 4-epimerase family protein [Sideroxydans lithotrophicus]|uniref:NAD-dependent epimerase/dehydratase n=1 Tax=Sideroxydans lithotrophicus (strain ES-1) TaxID=580332 RepID=D5CQ86_SIDLE|nr:SDR family oxidoreductase [Sideroxydans lithotrophicus]ADE13107.1 NAD-dependent epimerase/dehydratase [Sideroxydans lithotrophicus ES-1]
MRFLVVGANGFVGRPLCKELARRGEPCRAAVRSANPPIENVEFVKTGVIDGQTNWSDALLGIDVVIHLAARAHVMHENSDDPISEYRRVNLYGTINLAEQAALAGVKRFVYVSSVKVNGEGTKIDYKFTETNQINPQDPYGVSKSEAEQALHLIASRTNLEVVIVRPPLVYGAGVKGNFAQMLKVLAKGVPLPLASAQNQRSLVYVENLVDALIACAMHPAAAGQTYLVSDGEDISTLDLLRRLGAAMGRPARLFPCPAALLRLAGQLSGKTDQVERLLGSLQVDSGKIRRELNWTPPYSLQQGLQATAEWYRTTHL